MNAIDVKRLFMIALFLFALGVCHANAAVDDRYLSGYAGAVLEREFHLKKNAVMVKDGVIVLRAADLKGADTEAILTALLGIQGVSRVVILEAGQGFTYEPQRPLVVKDREKTGMETQGVLFPRSKLFAPLIADPRWAHFSVAYHHYINDEKLKNVGSTSFGETFIFYRGKAFLDGQWDLGIQAAVFAIFDLDAASKDLINADYWIGFPVSYRKGPWSALLRLFHQSSHLGDEYLLNNRTNRVNLSYQAVDAKFSYDYGDWLRLYGGGGVLFDQEPAELKPWSLQYGIELHSPRTYFGGTLRPIAAADLKNWEQNNWNTDISVRSGIQIEGERTVGHKVQIMLEYFRGHSPNGQFYERPIQYLGLGTHFYF
jgi:hypothetical protein